MADQKDVSNGSTPHKEIDIPNLKKKEEKKGGGVSGNLGNQAASGSGVAAGGSGSAASSAVSAASQAAASAGKIASTAAGELGKASIKGLFSNFSATFSTLVATTAGKAAVAMVVLGVGGGAAAVINSFSGGSSAAPGGVNLAAITSTVKIDKPTDKALKYAAESGKKDEDIKFDGPKNKKKKKDGKDGNDGKEDGASMETSNASGGMGSDGGPLGSSDAAENAPETAQEGGPLGDHMDHSIGGLTGAVGQSASGAAYEKGNFSGKGLKGLSEYEKANAGVGKGTAGGIRSIARNMKRDDQMMTNAGGRRLDKTGLQRLRKMIDYNKLMTKNGVGESATEASATQFDGMEVAEQAKAPISPRGTSVNPNKMGSGTNPPVVCRAPMVNQGGFCACPEGTIYTSDGGSCSVSGEDRTQWAGKLEDSYDAIDKAKNKLIALMGVFALLMALSAMNYYTTICSGGWSGYIQAAILLVMLITYMSLFSDIKAIEQKGDEIAKIPGGQKIGENVKDIGKDLQGYATYGGIVLIGQVLMTVAFPGAGFATAIVTGVAAAGIGIGAALDISDKKEDLKNDSGKELKNQCSVMKEDCLQKAKNAKFEDPEKECPATPQCP